MASKVLLESLPLVTPFLAARAVFPHSRGMGWGKADRRPPIPLPTAMGSRCIPAVGLKGAGDRDLLLTGAGNPMFPGQEEALAPHTC